MVLARLIRIVVLVSFIFSSFPVKNNPSVYAYDNLRALAAKQNPDDVINITRELYKATYAGSSCKDLLKLIPGKFLPEYVFFDVDDTLIDALSVAKLFARAARNNGVTLSAEYVRKFLGVIKFGDPDEAMAIFSGITTNKETVKLIIEDYNKLFEKALKEDYFKEFLYADIKEVFSYLKSLGIKIGIVTNRYEELAFKQMESIGLLEYIAQDPAFKRTNGYAVLGGDSAQLFQKEGIIASGKAKGAALNLLMKIFGIESADKCLMAGDTGKDIEAARFNNMPSFLVVRSDAPKDKEISEKTLAAVSEALEKIYEEKGADMDDYYVPALVVTDAKGEPVAKVKKGDTVIWTNHRADRSLEAMLGFTDPAFNKNGNRFDVENLGLNFVPFTDYDNAYFKARGIQPAFTSKFALPSYKSVIEVLQQAGVMQGYFTESDKGQHVTYFFAGQRNIDYAALGIKVSVVSSEGVEDKKKGPRMKYDEITANVIDYLNETKGISKKKIIVVNLPVDIQGHNIKGNKERAKETVLAADAACGRIREAILAQKGVYIETSDHGNIEKLATLDENGMPVSDKYGVIPFDQHTTNPVNFIIDGLGKNIKLKEGKGLSNIAATLLEILGISKPEEMGESLLSDYQHQNVEGPIVLLIRDGWGVNKFENKEAKENNGIELAQPPVFLDLIKNCPHTTLKAHGEAVGLPDYQMGDSDNGHRVIGTGFNPATLYKQIIDKIDDRSFFENPVLRQAFESAKKEKGDVHIMGLYSVGGIHSDNRYFQALMEMAKQMKFEGKVNIWPILDGRDVMTRIPTESGIFYIKQIREKISELKSPNIQLGGVIGRNFAMDRDAINRDKDADKKEKLAATKTGIEADRLKQEVFDSRKEAGKIWEQRFKVAYRLWVNGEGMPVKSGRDGGEKKTDILAEVGNIISGSKGKIKAALFDIGGVLLDYPRSSVVKKFQNAIKLKSGKEMAYDDVEKLIFTGSSAQKLREGYPVEYFVDELNKYLSGKLNIRVGFELKEFMDMLFLDCAPPSNMVNLVRNLKAGKMPLYVLSNSFTSNKSDVKKLMKDKLNYYYSKPGEEEIFNDENLIMSNEIGVAKPNRIAFDQALERINDKFYTQLKSDNIIFFDDQWENAAIARQLGYYTFGFNEEVSGVINFINAQTRVFKATGGTTIFREYLEKVNDEILKLRNSIADNNVALVVDASFLRKGGAMDALREVLQLKPFVKLGIYGKGADKLSALFNGDKDVITTDTLEDMVAALNNRGGVARGKDIVVLRPSATLDPDLETLKQVGFSEKGISTVDVAKAMAALVGTPGNKEAFKKFYGELKDQRIITSVSYDATKNKMNTELTTGIFDLPQIEPEQKVSEIITRESEAVAKFVDNYV